MGLGASKELDSKPSDPLSFAETQQLKAVYDRATAAGVTSSGGIFHSHFIAKIIEAKGVMQRFDTFREFAVLTTKGSTKKAMESTWEMLRLHHKSCERQHSLLYYFVLFVVELAIINGNLGEVDDDSKHVFVEKYKQYIVHCLSSEEANIYLGKLLFSSTHSLVHSSLLLQRMS